MVDITISLSNLQNVLDDTVKSILAGIQAKIAKKQFDIEEYSKAVNRVEDIKEEVEDLKFLLNCTDEEKNEWKKRNLQDLPVFKVDKTIEHTLNESFQYTVPYGFSIGSSGLIKVKDWKNLFYKVCEYLIGVDEKILLSFADKKYMNGKRTKYFSKNPKELVNPISVNGKIYIKSLKDVGVINNLITKVLDEYGYSTDDFVIYLESDFTDLYI